MVREDTFTNSSNLTPPDAENRWYFQSNQTGFFSLASKEENSSSHANHQSSIGKTNSLDRHKSKTIMEGLIPQVYKAIKRRATRRRYRSLSGEGDTNLQMDDEDVYPNRQYFYHTPQTEKQAGRNRVLNNGGFSRDQDVRLQRSRSVAVHGNFHHRGGDGEFGVMNSRFRSQIQSINSSLAAGPRKVV